MVVEAGKPYNMLHANWTPRKASGINSSLSPKVWEPGHSWWCKSQSEKTGVSSSCQAESEFNSFLPFCSFRALEGFVSTHPHRGGQSALLSPPIKMLIYSRNTQTQPKPMFNQISGHLVAQSSWHIKLIITAGLCAGCKWVRAGPILKVQNC